MRKLFKNVELWLKNNPQKAFQYMMWILLLSFIWLIVEVFVLDYKQGDLKNISTIPTILNTSDKYIEKQEKIKTKKHSKVNKILKELEMFKHKEVLDKNDSIRIEYLLNQYNKLKNENE